MPPPPKYLVSDAQIGGAAENATVALT